jgi:hypothetical protein
MKPQQPKFKDTMLETIKMQIRMFSHRMVAGLVSI